MGYQVTIMRTDEDDEDGLISKEEWLAYVANDSELTIEDENENFPLVVWNRDANRAELSWENIGVWSWSPEEATIVKMIEIAEKFSAKVVGEDGTLFTQSEGGILETSPEVKLSAGSDEVKPWWKRFFG